MESLLYQKMTRTNKITHFLHFAEFKLLIAAGISNESYTNTSEIIDLEQSSDLWNEVKQFPIMVDTPMAGLLNQRTPIMCGIFRMFNIQ